MVRENFKIINKKQFSQVYQILQECPFECAICHRRLIKKTQSLNPDERRRLVDILKKRGLRRLTITGGEPTILGAELFDFLKYVHDNQIHSCLSTSGYNLTLSKVENMNNYLDQLLISIRSLDKTEWIKDFGNTPHALKLFYTVLNLLQWIKTTDIILEISTVVHKENVDKIIDLGWQLVSLNPNIIWRIEEYYAMGIRKSFRKRFELQEGEFDRVFYNINHCFGKLFKNIRGNKSSSRVGAPDYLITPSGELVTTSNNGYSSPKCRILIEDLPQVFNTRRPWSDYKSVCREWGWEES